MSSGLGGGVLVRFGADDLVDVAGDVALEAAHDLGFWFAFGEASGHIFLCGFVPAEADVGDAVQAGVGLPVAGAVESDPVGFTGGGGDGADSAEGGEGGLGVHPVRVVAGGEQDRGGAVGSDAVDGHQGRGGPGGELLDVLGQGSVFGY